MPREAAAGDRRRSLKAAFKAVSRVVGSADAAAERATKKVIMEAKEAAAERERVALIASGARLPPQQVGARSASAAAPVAPIVETAGAMGGGGRRPLDVPSLAVQPPAAPERAAAEQASLRELVAMEERAAEALRPPASRASATTAKTVSKTALAVQTTAQAAPFSRMPLTAGALAAADGMVASEMRARLKEEGEAMALHRSTGEAMVLGDEEAMHEIREALAAWDAESPSTWQEVRGTTTNMLAAGAGFSLTPYPAIKVRQAGNLSVAQRRLISHASNEVRLAKRAWADEKIELKHEREALSEELQMFARRLKKQVDGLSWIALGRSCGRPRLPPRPISPILHLVFRS